ncbi:MAG: hypothetical protein RL391_697, partial [Actinomycetota bacterium]
MRSPRTLVVLVALIAIATRCSMNDSTTSSPGSDRTSSSSQPNDGSELRVGLPASGFGEGGFPLNSSKQPRDYDKFLVDAIADIEQFWETNYPLNYGADYPPLEGGVHPHFPGNPEKLPRGCDFTGDYDEVTDNAFYCEDGDFIVYDDDVLFPDFADEFGLASVGLIVAHEWGHVIQSSLRADILDSFVNTTLELQADCFVGAWVADVQANGIDGYRFSDADLTSSLLGLVQLGDMPGDVPEDPAAHGSAFDRVSAFQDGFFGGLQPCVDYEINEPIPLQFGFSPEEYQRQSPGDFPFDQEMFDLMADDLTYYWDSSFAGTLDTWKSPRLVVAEPTDVPPACGTGEAEQVTIGVYVCSDTATVTIDVEIAQAAYDEIPGDFAVGYLISVGYADLVLRALGATIEGEQRQLFMDCFAGMWAGDILPTAENLSEQVPEDVSRITLSPGDLDEAIRMAIFLGDETTDTDSMGTAFEKVDAFR